MDTLHGGSQATGRMINQNIPKSPLPDGVSPADLPTPEFLQTIEEMEKAKLAPPTPKPQVSVQNSPSFQKPVADPIQLTYRYTGQCPNGHSVTTLEMDVEGKHFVVAYCLAESRQIESREVANLKLERAKDKLEITMKNDPTVKLVKKKKRLFKKKLSAMQSPAQPGAKLSEKSEGDQVESEKKPSITQKNEK